MGDMDKDDNGPSVYSLVYRTTICMGYGDYKRGSQLFKKTLSLLSGDLELPWLSEL